MAERETDLPSRSRRRLLIGAATMAAFGGAMAFPLMRGNEPDIFGAMLKRRLPDLHIAPDELGAFCADFVPFYQERNRTSRRVFLWIVRTLWTYLPNGGQELLPQAFSGPHERLEQELLMAFLMGTDYLEVRHDPEARVRYLNMPDPYDHYCTNVFAKFD